MHEKEVEKAFIDTLQELFSGKYRVQKLNWHTVWKKTNEKLSSQNPYKNGYGKNKPYPSKEIIKQIEEIYCGKLLELNNTKVLFSYCKTINDYTTNYNLSIVESGKKDKEIFEAIKKAFESQRQEQDLYDLFEEYKY